MGVKEIRICSKCGFTGNSTEFKQRTLICKPCAKKYSKDYHKTPQRKLYKRNYYLSKTYYKPNPNELCIKSINKKIY